MGSYREIEGNLLTLFMQNEFDAIAHGCNCQKLMGAGFAKQVREQFENVYLKDQKDKRSPLERFGDFTVVDYFIDSKKFYNLYTQFSPGPNFNYAAFEMSLTKMSMTLFDNNKIGLPQIGCGIGGADWDKVKEIIQRVLVNHNVTVVIYNK
jgi:O-acetyl-ADP-ribose deacetylase (regulator of RNase III)